MASFLITLLCGSFDDAVEAVAHTSDEYIAKSVRRLSVPRESGSFADEFKESPAPQDSKGGDMENTASSDLISA